MAEFDERWKRLVAAARRRTDAVDDLPEPRLRALTALADRAPEPRPFASVERRAALALVALLVCGLVAFANWDPPIRELCLVLPSRIPRPPHPPSILQALEAVSDLPSFLDFSPSSTESQP